MNRLDVYYRALAAYRRITSDPYCEAFRKAVSASDTERDALTVSRSICAVDEDWIDAIEKGIPCIEKAIAQERQFIHADGEVLPIERVKHVSRESVQHLARHSNLITKKYEGDAMIPDGLYSVQKQSDYAVYENRFLYLLLCYLRDFITVRYEKLAELSNRSDGALTVEKSVTLGDRHLTYSLRLCDGRKDDPFLRESNPSKNALDRIELALRAVISLLATPLMEEAGKAPKLTPPITKTNVLRMDHHFRGAMELYEYLCAYDKPGYSVTPLTESIAPFSDVLADELAETVGLTAFLAYEYGLGLNETLKNRFLEAQSAEKEEQLRKREQRLALLKKEMERGEKTAEEYILALEEQLRFAESENRRLQSVRGRLSEMTEKEAQAQAQILSLGEDNRLLREQLDEALRSFNDFYK